jgi:ubiquinone biosynthesis protein COQ4
MSDRSLFLQRDPEPEESTVADPLYAYSGNPLRNPLRYALALWRSVRDPANTHEVAIVEIGALRSRFGRRHIRPAAMLEVLARDPRTASRLNALQPSEPIDLAALTRLPVGTFGRVAGDHFVARGLNPNLADLPTDTQELLLLHHLYSTHDLWHVLTGWGNDLDGETGLAAFYCAQLGAAPFFAVGFALLILNSVFFQPTTLRSRIEAWNSGWQAGLRAEPLFGLDWPSLWSTPIEELRTRLRLDDVEIVGAGVSLAA